MSGIETQVDNATNTVAPSETVAPPPGGEQPGSTPAPVDTTEHGQDKPEATEAERQTRREARAFASMRRQINELQREVGRQQGRREAQAPSLDGTAEPTVRSGASEVERLRDEMAQRETERVSRSFWSSAAKEAKEKTIAGFEDARDAIRNGEVPTTAVMSHYLTEEAENKAALVVWLADNPEEAERIAGLNPVSAGAALAKADARLSGKPAPKTTKALPPVRTVGGSSTATDDPSTMSMDDYVAWRKRKS